jgi:hypothetical protein
VVGWVRLAVLLVGINIIIFFHYGEVLWKGAGTTEQWARTRMASKASERQNPMS